MEKTNLLKIKSIAEKIENNSLIKAIFACFMSVVPITIGIVIFSILIGLPLESWQNLLKQSGVYDVFYEIVNAATNYTSIYIAFSLAFFYVKEKGDNAIIGGLISLVSFLALIPLQTIEIEGETKRVLDTTYFSANGYFVAMLTAITVGTLFVRLNKVKGLKIKFGEEIPKQVSESLSSSFVVILLFLITFIVKISFYYSDFKTVFGFVNFLFNPIVAVGASPIAFIFVTTLANLLWFFGVHPSVVKRPYEVVVKAAMASNVLFFMNGDAMPFLPLAILSFTMVIGGSGGTLGLSIDALLFSKSKKYRSLGKLSIIPSLCNINEPVILGFPVACNFLFLTPMLLSPILCGAISWLACSLGFLNTFNPTVAMPMAIPYVISSVFKGGWQLFVLVVVCILIEMLVWLPFLKVADRKELKKESA
jgi:PTS system cellobiose-specific IIC component